MMKLIHILIKWLNTFISHQLRPPYFSSTTETNENEKFEEKKDYFDTTPSRNCHSMCNILRYLLPGQVTKQTVTCAGI